MLALLPAALRLGAEGEGEAIGWEYGTPPGLSPAEWPRHEKTGMPLAHGFTVRVPAAYRVKGPEFVALSFFHPADSEACYGENDRVAAVLEGEPLEEDEQSDPYYAALAEHLAARETPSAERIIQTFVDMLGHMTDPKIVQALEEMKAHTSFLRVLGSYPMDTGDLK
jgi:hypothetical protein